MPFRQVLERTVCVTVAKDGKHVKTLMDVCEMRQFSMQELNFAAKLLNLKVRPERDPCWQSSFRA